jgi:hypothetical protein
VRFRTILLAYQFHELTDGILLQACCAVLNSSRLVDCSTDTPEFFSLCGLRVVHDHANQIASNPDLTSIPIHWIMGFVWSAQRSVAPTDMF